MSLTKSQVIDRIVLMPNKQEVALIAIDGGEIPEDQARGQALLEKLAAYFEYFASGQFSKTYPQYAKLEICVMVVCSTPPTKDMKATKRLRDHEQPEILLPVEVMTIAEFRATFQRLAAEAHKS